MTIKSADILVFYHFVLFFLIPDWRTGLFGVRQILSPSAGNVTEFIQPNFTRQLKWRIFVLTKRKRRIIVINLNNTILIDFVFLVVFLISYHFLNTFFKMASKVLLDSTYGLESVASALMSSFTKSRIAALEVNPLLLSLSLVCVTECIFTKRNFHFHVRICAFGWCITWFSIQCLKINITLKKFS